MVTNNEAASRYEIHVDGELAGFLEYRNVGGVLALVHTEVDDAYAGQGLGGKLARFALDDVKARGVKISPLCPFVAKYIDKHPEYRVTIR
ncbi:GNAT family N-acetyltransferase [Lentzea sp. HUAS12]|uniref:GNAT family N-acetyltransferase n=1 Tax=Lentzea sp. HUAS12 TaxID=2951806 RepID=UPI00209E4560|nr:GNAT family N-acetyltransferase [Lentzea sp. HUAS12]USX52620.1 N-acetyltransferase [Lentzea sp. HUAS12]